LLASSLKSQKKIEKELIGLRVPLRTAIKYVSLMNATDAPETDIFGALRNAIGAMLAASVVLFNKVIAISEAASTSVTSSALPTITPFKKKICKGQIEMLVYVKYDELYECVKILESGRQRCSEVSCSAELRS
jgi:hypothetical protein